MRISYRLRKGMESEGTTYRTAHGIRERLISRALLDKKTQECEYAFNKEATKRRYAHLWLRFIVAFHQDIYKMRCVSIICNNNYISLDHSYGQDFLFKDIYSKIENPYYKKLNNIIHDEFKRFFSEEAYEKYTTSIR